MKRSYTYYISSLICFCIPYITYGNCLIENGPSPILTEYIKIKEKEIQDIQKEIRKKNNCQGNFSQGKKFISSLDNIGVESNILEDMSIDFGYKVMGTWKGNTKDIVYQHGTIINALEKKMVSTLKYAADSCNLDTSYSGSTIEKKIGSMIEYNRKVENYFKIIAIGPTTNPDLYTRVTIGLKSSIAKDLAEEIHVAYSPSGTAACRGNVQEQKISEILEGGIMKGFQESNNALAGWQRAIDLFRGNAKDMGEIQKKLLERELSRQGFSQAAIQASMKKLSCIQKESKDFGGPIDFDRIAIGYACRASYVSGLSEVYSKFTQSLKPPKTISEYIAQTEQKKQVQSTNTNEVIEVWTDIENILLNADEVGVNESLISNLSSLHIQLKGLNNLIKSRTKKMQENCMKGDPKTVGGCK